MNLSFWKGKRVFVTGHTGFKGSWLSLWLQMLGAELTGYSLQVNGRPNLFEMAKVESNMNSIIGDIRDKDKLLKVLQESAPEVVVHMAAQSLVLPSYVDPVETYSTNIMGTVYLLESVRSCPSVRAVINVTSDKCYENREWIWPYRENEAMGGYDPYSSSKGCSELITSAYRNSFFNNNTYSNHQIGLATARAGNVIGGGDRAESRLVPELINAFSSKRTAIIRNPHSIRPWQHVLEPIRGYLMLAEKLCLEGPAYAEPFNFGPNDEDMQTVEVIVNKISKMWEWETSWKSNQKFQQHEGFLLRLDNSKSKQKLNWYPLLNLDTALQLTVQWERAQIEKSDLNSLTCKQISDYQDHIINSKT